MRTLSILFAGLAAVLAFGLPAHAQDKPTASVLPPAALGGPQSLIYFVPGVYDNGGADNTGRATTFFCTNASTVAETLRVVVRSAGGTIVSDLSFNLASAQTFTLSTHFTVPFGEDASLATGGVNGGFAFIFSTTQLMFCSAMIVDASSASVLGIALHMVRFAPLAGTQE